AQKLREHGGDTQLMLDLQRHVLAALEDSFDADDKTVLENARALTRTSATLDPDHVIIFGDLNRFKRMNDEHGHHAGDAAIAAAGRALWVIATSYRSRAYRQSGDEFVLIAPKAVVPRLSAHLARSMMGLKFTYAGHSLVVAMSFGTARRGDHVDFQSALKAAEDAAQVAKKLGDGVVTEWKPDLTNDALHRRFRCAKCGTQTDCWVPAERDPSPPLKCPACGEVS
ncbi:MAG: hypothetical protein JWM74_5922, partial [Myxococcaceae bacterium]|nr:hypothetical protein [Myxococcaceae bacterium]